MKRSIIDINVDIGKAIENGLMKQSWSRKDLAESVGVTTDLVSKWIRNDRTPTGHDIIKIACVLGIVNDLFPIEEQSKVRNMQLLRELQFVKEKIADIESRLNV